MANESSAHTKLDYYQDMSKLQSTSSLLSHFQDDEGRFVLTLESTIFHPQGGGQPFDTGFIEFPTASSIPKFIVNDVRSKDGRVFHYGTFENLESFPPKLENTIDVLLTVDESRRKLNSRLHLAGHLIDVCMENIGLGHLEPGKGHHYPDGPFVEYKGSIPQNEIQLKQKDLELEANKLISEGRRVIVSILPYEEAAALCGGCLPNYIPKESTPRIVRIGDYPGCPCGGTHVSDISEIMFLKVSQIRIKKGLTKVFYNITP
ncbi:alanine--tRNA ligase [Impatiens glandulifera]|uniref:alanine--tRNA ligase n=1 Tax=Impatiens glandulifera TaxID=253017 RepID=UPI001FB136AC|nr:alanine--tRNA ligase [Impatiens glandulifera]